MKEAMFFDKSGDNIVKCSLCRHRCTIGDSKRGICTVRENRKGTLYSLVYGKVVSSAVDPIEKKPLFHFSPGSRAYSIATMGCNFRCGNCQNFEISQMPRDRDMILGQDISPEEIVMAAKRNNCESIAYTYTEPTIFYEFAYDTAKLAGRAGIKNVFVTNGYMTEEALAEISPYLDAANIDLKSYSEDFYRRNCGAHLDPVLDSIRLHKNLGIWIEITTLVIPTLNDTEMELRKIAQFIRDVGREVPWHISRFYPAYRLRDLPPTPIATLRRAREIGLGAGLRYVYVGNVPSEAGENTYCYQCGKPVIRRFGYRIAENRVEGSACSYCGANVDGVNL